MLYLLAVVVRSISILRRKASSPRNFNIQFPFYTRTLRNVEGLALNISVHQNYIYIYIYIYIAPPTRHRKSDTKYHNVMPHLLLAHMRHTEFGVHICHEQMDKKPSWTHTVSPTGSHPLWWEPPFYPSFENYLLLEIKQHSLHTNSVSSTCLEVMEIFQQHHTWWKWWCGPFKSFAVKHQVIITSTYNSPCTPNLSGM